MFYVDPRWRSIKMTKQCPCPSTRVSNQNSSVRFSLVSQIFYLVIIFNYLSIQVRCRREGGGQDVSFEDDITVILLLDVFLMLNPKPHAPQNGVGVSNSLLCLLNYFSVDAVKLLQ